MVVYERELALLASTKSIAKFVAVEKIGDSNKVGWILEIYFREQPSPASLINARNEVRRFAQLNSLVAYLKDVAPSIDTLVVRWGGKH